jgi:hypothetical protein
MLVSTTSLNHMYEIMKSFGKGLKPQDERKRSRVGNQQPLIIVGVCGVPVGCWVLAYVVAVWRDVQTQFLFGGATDGRKERTTGEPKTFVNLRFQILRSRRMRDEMIASERIGTKQNKTKPPLLWTSGKDDDQIAHWH